MVTDASSLKFPTDFLPRGFCVHLCLLSASFVSLGVAQGRFSNPAILPYCVIRDFSYKDICLIKYLIILKYSPYRESRINSAFFFPWNIFK